MRSLLLFLFCFSLLGCFAQSGSYLREIGIYDKSKSKAELRKVIDKINQEAKDSVYLNSERSKRLARIALGSSVKIKYTTGKIESYLNLAQVNLNLNDLDSGLYYANLGLDLSIASKLNSMLFKSHMTVGTCYYYKGLYDKASEEYFKAVNFAEKVDKKLAISGYANLGLIFKLTRDYSRSEKYLKKSLELGEKYSDTSVIIASLNLLGLLDKIGTEYDLALLKFNKALQLAEESNNVQKQSEITFNMSNAYFHKEDYVRGFDFFEKSVALNKGYGSYTSIVQEYYSLSSKYFEIGRYKEAEISSDTSLNYALKIGHLDLIIEVYSLKAKIARQQGKINEAYEFLGSAYNYKDSLNLTNMNSAILDAESAFKKEKRHLNDSLKQLQSDQQIILEKKISDKKLENRDNLIWFFAFSILVGAYSLFILLKNNRFIRAQKRIKEQFLSNTSHEIRAPLQSIIGNTDLLIKNDDKNSELLKTINHSGKYLLSVVNDILDQSKIESGKLELEEISIDLRKELLTVINLFTGVANEREIDLDLVVSEDVPETMKLDPTRLKQVIVNLIGNALKFTNEGFVLLSADVKEDRVVFLIQDSGIGIEANKLESIFDVYSQEHKSTTRIFGGTGLGLNITKQLIELMGGSIDVTSTVSEGTSFIFNIPFTISDDELLPEVEQLMDLKGTRVLVVEDSRISSDTIKRQLNYLNAKVDCVSTGEEAVELVNEVEYDLVLLDFKLPGINGIEVVEQLRGIEGIKLPKIVSISGESKSSLNHRFKSDYIDAFLEKPFDLFKLNYILRSIFKDSPTLAEKPVLSDSIDSFDETVKSFLSEVPPLVHSLRIEMDTNKLDRVRFLIHKIKPCYYYIGEYDLYNFIDNLENKFSEFTSERIDESIQYIEENTSLIIEKIKKNEI